MPLSRAILTTSIAAVISLVHTAGARDILRPNFRPSARGTAQAADTRRAGSIFDPTERARAVQNGMLSRTTRAAEGARTLQSAARAAALRTGAARSIIPNGLRPGGLEVAPGVPRRLESPLAGENAALWTGARLPAQSVLGDRTLVTIQQTKPQAVLNWKTFNVGSDTTVRFDQSAGGSAKGSWVAINRISDPTGKPSQILGAIEAPGQVYVINRNGIIFHGSSQVNVRSLVASALPINDNLVQRGLLNNPDTQFLFSALPLPAGAKGTPAFNPGEVIPSNPSAGDVIVQAGARLTSPLSPDGNGGRIMLVGANVRNAGTIATPEGQAILAAGLQVGVNAHQNSDPSLRGLDVYVGKVTGLAGTVENSGIVESFRGSVAMVGRNVRQLGIVESSTSVSLNGRVDLAASYDAISNPNYNAAAPAQGAPFLFQSSGSVELGLGSITRIVPEVESTATASGLELALRSQVNLQGRTVHLAQDAVVLAPNAAVVLRAGRWATFGSANLPASRFVAEGGQVYLDAGAAIDVAGTAGSLAPLEQNILELSLRGAELAPSPLQREGALRGPTLTVDLRRRGNLGGREWIGTPLGDITGYLGLIQRTAGELTSAGGTVDISAGGSVVIRSGAAIDVSGGTIQYAGGMVQTSRVLSGGRLIDIADATPDRVYDGIYTGRTTITNAKWSITETFTQPLALLNRHFEAAHTHGADAGSLTISAPSMAIDGELRGITTPGPRQVSSARPRAAALTLQFRAETAIAPGVFTPNFPAPPAITFRTGMNQPAPAVFAVDANGDPLPLSDERRARVFVSPELFGEGLWGSLTLRNEEGTVAVPKGVELDAGAGGRIDITSSDIDIAGNVTAPGGELRFTALNVSPFVTAVAEGSENPVAPLPVPGRGSFVLQPGARLSAAGTINDNRAGYSGMPLAVAGGTVSIRAYSVALAVGSTIDVSGGAILPASGPVQYGDAGAIEIRAGQDPLLTSALGGALELGAELRGFSGARGGSLTVRAPLVQIGGGGSGPGTLLLQPAFFSTGGFGSFTIGALGLPPGGIIPSLLIAPGTVIKPAALSAGIAPPDRADGSPFVTLAKPAGLRTPVSLHFEAPGVQAAFSAGLVTRGDIVMGEGAVIHTDPLASVSFSGNTVAVLGSVYAPGGTITVRGGKNSIPLFADEANARVTAWLGPESVLSTAGTFAPSFDRLGRRTGKVLPGGTIVVAGNLAAAAGAVLDVSGASATLDLDPAIASPLASARVPAGMGVLGTPWGVRTVATAIASNGGTIVLDGGQILASDATLRGEAGGANAFGGSLQISSGRFNAPNVPVLPSDPTLTVRQSGALLPAEGAGIGKTLPGIGQFTADSFARGGFASLGLRGVVRFEGDVRIDAARELSVADGGFLYASGLVQLSAPYVALGQPLLVPGRPEQRASPFAPLTFAPTHGTGRLEVSAGLLDIGNLSLQQIGSARLAADGGDIRGSGTFAMAGDLVLRAAQIYPATAVDFTVVAYDYKAGETARFGSVTIQGSGAAAAFPLSAGGALSVHGSTIRQGGVLRAPLGTITLGWDGTGTRPLDLLTGTTLPFPVTRELTLAAGSTTSVSAIDPATGLGVLIPYGVSLDGTSWIDPRGVDITSGNLPEKSIRLAGGSVTLAAGATLDLRGGGDLYAYRFSPGNLGAVDILASEGTFAILPGYGASFAPFAPFNTSADAANGIRDAGPGYSNSTLRGGDTITLLASATLPAGSYTLLPARYALLPGAVLVTPRAGRPVGTVETPEGASLVAGYRSGNAAPGAFWFEVAGSTVVRARAEYADYLANSFLRESAEDLGIEAPRLPKDSGYALFQATNAMRLEGRVLSPSIPGGRGSRIDISTPRDIRISAGIFTTSGAVSLSSRVLNAFGAESLVIGGRRTFTTAGATLEVQSANITVNNAGAPLTGPDITLVAKETIAVAAGAQIISTGSLTGDAETLTVAGNGSLLRVSEDVAAQTIRTGATPGGTPSLTVAAGALLSGGALILDTTGTATLDPAARLEASAYTLASGRISVLFANGGPLEDAPGLVLSGGPLASLQQAGSLTLRSYSSLDLYGTGVLGTAGLGFLSIDAAAIRGLNQGDGPVRISAGTILIGNTAGALPPALPDATSGSIVFAAGTVRLTSGRVAVTGYSTVTLDARRSITGTGTGGLSAQADLRLRTPLLTGAAGANRAIAAGGALELVSPHGARAAGNSGLGSTLTLSGATVQSRTRIRLPSGSLRIRATAGDLVLGGTVDVSGTEQRFFDVSRYTDAGTIELLSAGGDVVLEAGGNVSVAADPRGGNAGTLAISAADGAVAADGRLFGAGGAGGRDGSFELDVAELPSTGAIGSLLADASFTESQKFRVRTGDVLLDGTLRARTVLLSADEGGITVAGTVDASGATGGTIRLAARGGVALRAGSLLTVAGEDFSASGKGGQIELESGSTRNGIAGTGAINIQTGSTLDLSVVSKIAGSAATPGSSAFAGQFSGRLHLRAPRTSTNTDLLVNAINGTVIDPSSIVVEGYRAYDLTATAGTITTAVQAAVRNDATAFLGAAGAPSANESAMLARLFGANAGLAPVAVLAPGAEIIHRTGNLTLGSATSTATADWNLATNRFGSRSAPGVLTLRAAGNLQLFNALSDGFTSSAYNARLSVQNALLPVNAQSWSFRLVAGADFAAADFSRVQPLASLGAAAGSLLLGKNNGVNASNSNGSANSPGPNALTEAALTNRFQVIRTGSGDITVATGRSIQLLNHFATIYTAGTRVASQSLGGTFDNPVLIGGDEAEFGAVQQPVAYPPLYAMGGGDVALRAQGNIEHLTRNSAGQMIADSSRQLPNNWLYRRGYVDPATGLFGTVSDRAEVGSTSWWVDHSNFFQGIGALGGGNVSLLAGGDIANVDAVVPTNARMPKGLPSAEGLVELGGGDLTVRAGNNIDGGVYYVERGAGVLSAGGSIITNVTRALSLGSLAPPAAATPEEAWLPTTLFLGKGGFEVSARGDVLLGPVGNPFLLPVGLNNTASQKTYFSTYDPSSSVDVSSLGGSVTLRQSATLGAVAQPLLQAWARQHQLLNAQSSAWYQPWLRLAETSVDPFGIAASLHPGTIRVAAYSGDINVVGDLTLSPASRGSLELLADGAINALQPSGRVSLGGNITRVWTAARINVSDADPGAIPGIANPFGYQTVTGSSFGSFAVTQPGFLEPIDRQFRESGGTFGDQAVLQTKLALHAPGPLHFGDPSPVRLHARRGDVSGLTLFSPKFTHVFAGRDITDLSLYLQNVDEANVSIVAGGRDIIPYNANAPLRVLASAAGNSPLANSGPQAGDLQISGPGTLQVLAGRNLDLGTGPGNADGTGVGITSIGNARNPFLGFDGANLVVGAGIGKIDFEAFISEFVQTAEGQAYLEEAGTPDFDELEGDTRNLAALSVFYRVLRDAGRNAPLVGNYDSGFAAIASLFGDTPAAAGEVLTRGRDIRTRSGGNISILAPGGGLTLASTSLGNPLSPPGVITESGGDISIVARNSVNIGIGRIFTLRGGNQIIWSSEGDIAAGSSPKTVQSAPPTRVIIDPQSASVQTDLAGLATGGGIGVLATVKGVEPGNVDLIAPQGIVDAGDAGIRVSGNLNIAAVAVVNADNISVSGSSAGTPPAAVVAAPSLAGLAGPSSAAATASATDAAAAGAEKKSASANEAASIIFVEVTGYSSGEGETEEEERRRRRRRAGEEISAAPADPVP